MESNSNSEKRTNKVGLIIILGLLLLIIVGVALSIKDTEKYPDEYLPCRTPGIYCHQYNVQDGIVNITFSSVENGTFEYRVEV